MKQLPMLAGVAGSIEGEVVASSTSEAGVSPASGGVQAFSFGDPEGVLDRRDVLQYVETWHNGTWYEPPVSPSGLTKAFDIPGPHSSCIRLKVNLLVKYFRPSRWLSRTEFRKFALDYLVMANGYLERRDNLAGRPLSLQHSLARYTRRGIEDGRYFFVPAWKQEYEFKPGSVFHLIQEHPSQELYGVPEYMGALMSGFLNEEATLFRRRYYKNGSHAGFVFYLSEESIGNQDSDSIREALRNSKGVGNFKNLFIHAPKGKKDGVQIMPISDVAAKDEFLNIKNTTRDDVLCAHRTPPNLVGIVPANAAGFGDVGKATETFLQLEILPIMMRMTEVNDWLGLEAIAFDEIPAPAPAGAA